ncbi:branched-chain amino acid ABC transporter permease [Pseudonocardia ailaonensis]|uniref:Branched-chain amino acid ABC transporter permease n=1 Tax=Pseudonocardia ailaonensis TaxID=367279 RepID=A0ABN2N724_9PSEU
MQFIVQIATLGSIYLLFSLGLNLVWGSLGILNFAHGVTFVFAVYLTHLTLGVARLPFLVVLLLGAACGAVLTVLLQVLVFEPILRRSPSIHQAEMRILIGGLGFSTIPLAFMEHQTKNLPFGLDQGSFVVSPVVLGSFRATNIALYGIGLAVLLGLAIAVWLARSRGGLALRSLGVDAPVAGLMGIDRRRSALLAMALAGGLAGLAGVVYTYTLTALTPDSGDLLLVKAFAIVILGGVGSIAGAAVGSLVLAAAEVSVLTFTSGSWVDAVSFSLIFLMLVLRPVGLFGRKEVRRT